MNKISFCINTAVNELEYIKLLFNSLKDNLKYDHHEIIVFVDSDNENTFDWLLEQKAYFKDLKVLKNTLPVCYGYARNINEMFKFASHDIVSYLQSDMVISRDYDEYLLKQIKPNMVLSSTRIEPPLHGPGAEKHTMNFGVTPSEFNYEEFQKYCVSNRQERTTSYFFAPFTLYKEVWNSIGGHDTLFRRSREDSDILNRLILAGVEIVQTWEALVYHFTCTSSRGKGWFDKLNKEAQKRALLQQGADMVELRRINRKWGEFSHGQPTEYYYNIFSNIDIDTDNYELFKNVEMFFSKNYITSDTVHEKFISEDEHYLANNLLNFNKEQWEEYSYLYNTEKLEDRISLERAEGDIVVSFKLSSVNQNTFNNVLDNLQHIIHETPPGDYEFEGFTFSIKNKENVIESKIKITNPEINSEHLYEVY